MDIETANFIQTILKIQPNPIGYSLPCPYCYSEKTYFSCHLGIWLCLECGIRFRKEEEDVSI